MFEDITPEMAKEWLGKNHKNRTLSQTSVRHLVGVILRGEWMSDATDAIGLDKDGGVVNGQHRLRSVVEADKAIRCLVVRNVRPGVIAVIDQGTQRSLRQMLEMQGAYTDPGTVALATEWLYRMKQQTVRDQPRESRATIPQKLDLLAQHPNLYLSIDVVAPAARAIKRSRLTKAILTSYHYAMSDADNELALDFFDQLATGAGLSDTSPVYVLREQLLAEVAKQQTIQKAEVWVLILWLVRAWEAFRRGEEMTPKQLTKKLRAGPKADPFPTLSDVPWLETPAVEAEAEEEAAA